ncbi:amidohydrolase family protein [Nocardia sp. CA-136227]|uniref:amidohydrolase family protein n=1 Tax=Nocardia sp. CA-136227 TaxID=3239979 RepID=UPI003D984A4D
MTSSSTGRTALDNVRVFDGRGLTAPTTIVIDGAVIGANANPGVPMNPAFGASLHHELELLVAAGLSPAEALHAATAGPAERFGLADRGAVAPGLRADLVLLEGDPLTDITATTRIRRIWSAGTPVPR